MILDRHEAGVSVRTERYGSAIDPGDRAPMVKVKVSYCSIYALSRQHVLVCWKQCAKTLLIHHASRSLPGGGKRNIADEIDRSTVEAVTVQGIALVGRDTIEDVRHKAKSSYLFPAIAGQGVSQ